MNVRLKFLQWCLTLVCVSLAQPLAADDFLQRESVRQYLREVSNEHELSQVQLEQWFAGLRPQPGIIDAISRPAERVLTWREYRPIFLKEARIQGGKTFLSQHRALLKQAEAAFGVPASIITAIIGVETFYGKITGKHRVIEALATLAFDYPRRADFFRRELTEFLVLSHQENWETQRVLGSYAGAMGMPQFIASSYQQYAVDFDGDGKRDLFGNVADIIGSVANYLSVHGWQRDAPIAQQWTDVGDSRSAAKRLVRKSLKPSISKASLADMGFNSKNNISTQKSSELVSVMLLPTTTEDEWWVGYQNFYAITRYNHSRLYAMAVYQLSTAIEESSS